jgi:flagellar biosynthesis protein FliQ
MILILALVIGLVAWSLHLMQEAIQRREFSLMLAGFLVSVAAAALMTVYFLMGHYVGYMSQMSQDASAYSWSPDYSDYTANWSGYPDWAELTELIEEEWMVDNTGYYQ